MEKEVKIVWFNSNDTQKTEQEIAQLLNKGWVIAEAGGSGNVHGHWGFVILVKG